MLSSDSPMTLRSVWPTTKILALLDSQHFFFLALSQHLGGEKSNDRKRWNSDLTAVHPATKTQESAT